MATPTAPARRPTPAQRQFLELVAMDYFSAEVSSARVKISCAAAGWVRLDSYAAPRGERRFDWSLTDAGLAALRQQQRRARP